MNGKTFAKVIFLVIAIAVVSIFLVIAVVNMQENHFEVNAAQNHCFSIDGSSSSRAISWAAVYDQSNNNTIGWGDGGNVLIVWEGDASSYEIQYSLNGSAYSQIDTTSEKSYIFTTLGGNSSYRFKIVNASDSNDYLETNIIYVDKIAPEPVSNIRVQNANPANPSYCNQSYINLTWNNASDNSIHLNDSAADFLVYDIRVSIDGQAEEVIASGVHDNYYNFTVENYRTYRFNITARDIVNNSSPSNTSILFTVDQTPPPAVSEPSHQASVTVGYESDPAIDFLWNVPYDFSGIDHYEVYLSVNGSSYSLYQNTTTSNITIIGEEWKNYSILVIAVDRAGNPSALSMPSVRVVVDMTPPAKPINIRHVDNDTLNLSYDN
ncbi:MAG: fibronectin type III domain-containing protein, partial [Thermoplasmata archaeon]